MKCLNAVQLSVLSALLLAGCTHKPPPALVGKWDHVENLGLIRSTQRLTLRQSGKFRISELGAGSGPSVTGGPSADGGELLQAGTYTADATTIRFTITTAYVGGVDVGALSGGTVRCPYTVNGSTLTIQNARDLMLGGGSAPTSGMPGGTPAPRTAPGEVTLTKTP